MKTLILLTSAMFIFIVNTFAQKPIIGHYKLKGFTIQGKYLDKNTYISLIQNSKPKVDSTNPKADSIINAYKENLEIAMDGILLTFKFSITFYKNNKVEANVPNQEEEDVITNYGVYTVSKKSIKIAPKNAANFGSKGKPIYVKYSWLKNDLVIDADEIYPEFATVKLVMERVDN